MTLPDAPRIIRFSPSHAALAGIARHVIDECAGELPDLSGVALVLPSLAMGPEVRSALGQSAGRALILPRIVTLREWAESRVAAMAFRPDSRRQLDLYHALRARRWLDGADLWAVAAELVALFDALTEQELGLPATAAELTARLESIYALRNSQPLRFESGLIHALWRADAEEGLSRVAARGLALARLAEEASKPLYMVWEGELGPRESAFVQAYAQRQAVTVFVPDRRLADSGVLRLANLAWPPDAGAQTMLCRARALGGDALEDAAGRVQLMPCADLERQAWAVTAVIRGWLAAGRRRIALVAADRLAARRARALLERSEILLQDETGWKLSTTRAASLVNAWLEVVASDGHHRALLDLFKSPFLLAGMSREAKAKGIGQLEVSLPRLGLVAGLADIRIRLEEIAPAGSEAQELLRRLEQARGKLGAAPRSIASWLQSLLASLKDLGAESALTDDAAGQQLLAALQTQAAELAGDDTPVTVIEWREWLDRLFEAEMFRDPAVASPVRLTHLAASRMRSFDAVVLVGADRDSLKPPESAAMFFGDSVRRELGLAGLEQAVARLRDDLAMMLACAGEVVMTWQLSRGDEPNLPAAEVDLLDLAYTLATGASLQARPPTESAPRPIAEALTTAAAPRCPPERLPRRLSASGYGSLVACPYQYFACYVLELGEPDTVAEEMEKSDYGERVHETLRRFHQRFPSLQDVDEGALLDGMAQEGRAVFSAAVGRNFLDHAWWVRWQKRAPAYLAWARDREAAGWKVVECEAKKEMQLDLGAEPPLTLYGVLDRLDRRETPEGQEQAVLDYKTQRLAPLLQRAKDPGEDVQLPFYALLTGPDSVQAGFVALDDEKVALAAMDGLQEAALANRERLVTLFSVLRQGGGLPANGTEARCNWCEMQGLCRRAYRP